MSDWTEEIIVTGSRITNPNTGLWASGFDFPEDEFDDPDIDFVTLEELIEEATLVLRFDFNGLQVEVFVGDLSAELQGAIIKLFSEIQQSPELSAAFEFYVANGVTLEIHFDDVIHQLDGTTSAFMIVDENGAPVFHYGETNFLPDPNQPDDEAIVLPNTHFIISLNSVLIGSDLPEFATYLIHEFLHPFTQGIEGLDESAILDIQDQIFSGIFETDGTFEDDSLQYFQGGEGQGDAADETIILGEGHDRADGGAGNDVIFGLGGNDLIYGGLGVDSLYGGAGDDVLFVDDSDNFAYIRGGPGTDTLVIEGSVGRVIDAQVLEVENVLGSSGNDYIYGTSGANILVGGGGNDTLTGRGGDDTYFVSTNGNSTIYDTAGIDRVVIPYNRSEVSLSTQNESLILTMPSGVVTFPLFFLVADTVDFIEFIDQTLTDDQIFSMFPNAGGGPPGGNAYPVALDLDGDGVELVSVEDSNIFVDVNGDGILDRVGWIGADDGWLALDRNGNGIIDDFSEISFVQDLDGALTDLQGLLAFDTNGDGVLDQADERFGDFLVWQDKNQNAISDEGELFTLEELGITSINLYPTPTGQTLDGSTDNVILNTTTFTWEDGSEGEVADVAIKFESGVTGLSWRDRGGWSDEDADFVSKEDALSLSRNSADHGLVDAGGFEALIGGRAPPNPATDAINDILVGETGTADVFIFSGSFGDDTITDFEDGTDMLDFRAAPSWASAT